MRGLGERKREKEREREDEKGNLFRVAQQLVNKNVEVVGANCVKENEWKIVEEEDKLMEVWRAHYDGISNEEFPLYRKGPITVSQVCGHSEKISALEVDAKLLVR